MFVKICIERKPSLRQDIWINTDHIVSLRPKGKSFHVCLSDGDLIVLDLQEYLVLVKAMKIKTPLKSVKKKRPIPIYVDKPSPAATDKAKPKRTAGKGVEAIKRTDEIGKGVAGEKPKTKLIKKDKKPSEQDKKKLAESCKKSIGRMIDRDASYAFSTIIDTLEPDEHKRPKNSAT